MLTAVLILLIIVGEKRVFSVDPDASGCPQYVTEGASLYCECRAVNVENVQGSLPVASWPGQSANYQLSLTNVRREQNGTEFTCQVTLGDETKTTVYVMQVAYGPMDETVTVLGPDVFPTDGSKNLTLTCEATEVNPIPEFSWSGAICDEGNNGRTCTFRPDAPGDDGKRVSCRVTNRNTTPNPTIGETLFSVNVTYPPTTVPVITGYTEGQLLKTGDILTCTVSGGKPPVSAVLFQCSSPKLPDQEDVVVGSSVSSSLTIDTSQATEGNALCLCEAVWEPDFTLYRLTTTPALEIEFKASVLRFSMNDSTDDVTMNESDMADVELKCATTGRPRPNITLERQGDATPLRRGESDELSFRMSRVTCEKMGTYTCIADNGYSNPSQMSLRLTVYCAPKHTDVTQSEANRDTPPKLSSDGLNVTMVSFPVPNTFTFSFHGSQSSNPGQVVSSGMFSTTCIQSDVEDYLVTCQVKAYDVRAEDFGVYSMTLDNGLGTLDYYFTVDITVAARPTTSTDDDDNDDSGETATAAIAGGAAAGVVVIVIIVAVVAAFIVKGRKKENGDPDDSAKSQDDDEVLEEHINVTYVSADDIDQNSNSQSSPRKKSPDSVALSSARSTGAYDDVSDVRAKNNEENETDFGYSSVNGGNVQTGLEAGKDSEPSQEVFVETDTYASVDEDRPRPSPAPRSIHGTAYAVVEINSDAERPAHDPVLQSDDYVALATSSAREDTKDPSHDNEGEPYSQTPETTVGPLGDIYSQVDRASKKNKKNPAQTKVRFAEDDAHDITGPLGDVYAQVHKPPREGSVRNANGDRDDQSQAPVQKPKRQSKPKPDSVPKAKGNLNQSGAATETVQDHNAGTSYEDISPSVGTQARQEDYEEVALASSESTTKPKVPNNDQPEDEYSNL